MAHDGQGTLHTFKDNQSFDELHHPPFFASGGEAVDDE
jgi:hypothetical protein